MEHVLVANTHDWLLCFTDRGRVYKDQVLNLPDLGRYAKGRAVEGRGVGQMLLGLSNGVAARVPMTATAYPLRGTGLSSLIAASWDKPETRARAERWVTETGAALRPWARRAYVNYLPPSMPERIREIYGVNYQRLAWIKAQYDPANLFRENQNIRPAVGSGR